jgi:hypothetical protein
MKRVFLLSVIVVNLIGGAAHAAPAGGPPAGLTSSGLVVWNLDALLNDTFGSRTECYRVKTFTIIAVPRGHGCGYPEVARQYEFTFSNAQHSTYRLVGMTQQPNVGALNVPLRVDGRYVACDKHNGVLGVGGEGGSNAFAWCVPTG